MLKRRVVAAAGLALPLAAQASHAQTGSPAGSAAQGAELSPTPAIECIADLVALVTRPRVVFVVGYHRGQDRGGGFFRWTAGDSTPADNALVVAPATGPAGRFRRIFSGPIDATWFGARGDGTTDDTAALQAALDHCTSSEPSGPALYLPSGRYRTTGPLRIPREYLQMYGDGMWRSQISFKGVAGGGLTTADIPHLKPVLRDFALVGDAASGRGIDFSTVRNDVYLGELKNLHIEAGDDGLLAPTFFSMIVDNVVAHSHRGHAFRASCGPGVAWRNCYALAAGPGKAGYRLTGAVAMYSCNGVNQADYWGVFGCDPKATDGFQDDFSEATLAHATLVECNVEDWGTGEKGAEAAGILLHNAYRQFNMIGGKIIRVMASTPYHSVIRSRIGPSSAGGLIRLSPGIVELGTGPCRVAPLVSDGRSFFADENGALAARGVTTWREATRDYPVIRMAAVNDTSGLPAIHFSGLSSDRLAIEKMRFNPATPSSGTAAIGAQGKTAVVTANTTPTAVETIAIDAGPESNAGAMLIVQVEDDYTTFRHAHPAIGGMRMKGATDYKARKGDVLLFLRSNFFDGTQPGWTQI